MKNLATLLILQLPIYIFGQQVEETKLCSETFAQFFPYDVCTYDDTLGSVFFHSEFFNSIYNAYYELHFNTLDTFILNKPDTGSLTRFWYLDESGKKSWIDLSNDELYDVEEEFEKLDEQIWETVSKWRFFITNPNNSFYTIESNPKDIWVDFVIPILCTKQ